MRPGAGFFLSAGIASRPTPITKSPTTLAGRWATVPAAPAGALSPTPVSAVAATRASTAATKHSTTAQQATTSRPGGRAAAPPGASTAPVTCSTAAAATTTDLQL